MAETFYPSEVVDIDSLKPWPTNYVIHGQEQTSIIATSLETFGQFKNIVTWRGYIVAGHGLVEAARDQGWRRVEVKRLPDDWDETTVEGVLVADNRTAELSTKNETLLGNMLQRIRQSGPEALLPATGYSSAQVDSKLRALSQMGFVGYLENAIGVAPSQYGTGYQMPSAPVADVVSQPTMTQPASNGSFPTPPISFAPSDAPPAYVQLQFPLNVEQRARVLTVLKHIQDAQGLNNSIHALIQLCERYAQEVGL